MELDRKLGGKIAFPSKQKFANCSNDGVGKHFSGFFVHLGQAWQRPMNQEFLAILDYWEREKGIRKETLIGAVEEALVSAAKKAVGPARNLRCEIDRKTGDIRAYAHLLVVESVSARHDEISLSEAKRIKRDAELGEEVEKEVTPRNFGRIAAQYAKQALLQQVRRAEKALIYEEFKDRTGDVVSGVVRRFERSDVIVDLGRYEATLPNRERVPTEEYQPGERIRCFVKAVEETGHGPEIILSRADAKFVVKLFRLEVSEINDGTVEIRSVAREPGFRTKLAVFSSDHRVDPVGACVGLRGQRVKNIVRELNNEKVDIIKWDPDLQTYVSNALAPAQIRAFELDEANRRVKVLVSEDQLSLAIGRRGQNARLTSKLTGWQVDIEEEKIVELGFDDKVAQAVEAIAGIDGIDSPTADKLVHAGFLSLEDLLQVEADDLADVPELAEQAGQIIEAVKSEDARRNEDAAESEASETTEGVAEAPQADTETDE